MDAIVEGVIMYCGSEKLSEYGLDLTTIRKDYSDKLTASVLKKGTPFPPINLLFPSHFDTVERNWDFRLSLVYKWVYLLFFSQWNHFVRWRRQKEWRARYLTQPLTILSSLITFASHWRTVTRIESIVIKLYTLLSHFPTFSICRNLVASANEQLLRKDSTPSHFRPFSKLAPWKSTHVWSVEVSPLSSNELVCPSWSSNPLFDVETTSMKRPVTDLPNRSTQEPWLH